MKKGTDEEGLLNFLQKTFLAYQIKYGTNEIDQDGFHSMSTHSRSLEKLKKMSSEIKRKSKRSGARGNDPVQLNSLSDQFVSAADLHEENENLLLNEEINDPDALFTESELKEKLKKIVKESLDFLSENEFIDISNDNPTKILKPTKLGDICSQLYLKPSTAEGLYRRLQNIKSFLEKNSNQFKITDTTYLRNSKCFPIPMI